LPNTIYNSTDRKLYRWNGSTYIATIAASDVGNGLTSAQISDLDAAKLTGTLNVSRIASGALDATKFANTIEPITLVAVTPLVKSTSTIFNTVTGKLLKWNGSAYVGSVDAADLNGTITNSQITDGTIAATKFASSIEPITVVGSLPGVKSTNVVFNSFDGKMYRWDTNTNAYISTIPGSDVIGSVSTTSIADGSITATKFASGIEPVGVVAVIPGAKTLNALFNTANGKLYRWNGSAYTTSLAAADITVGTITNTQIADGAITTPKLSAGNINANVLAAGTITTNLMTANSISGDRIQAASLDAGKIVAGSVTATQIAALGITGDKIAAQAISADKIVSNSLTSAQIQAGSITGDRIQANTISSGNIVSGTLTSTQIAAGGITGDRIAAGTITADKIQSNSLTSTQIAAGTITADKLAANSITSGQIQAGAIGAGQIASNAITTSKLLVTGRGSALNADPNTSDATAWLTNVGFFSIVTDVVTSGTTAIENTQLQAWIRSIPVGVDATKNYNARINVKQQSGSSTTYLGVSFQDANGTELVGNGPGNGIGWPGAGSFFYFGLINQYPSASWTEYQISFGPGETAKIPAGAKTMSVGIYSNYTGTGVQRINNVRLEQKADSDLIVDGAITTQKMTANSINGDRILANSLTASKITAGSITTDRFTANSIGGSILQDGTIAANKIEANSITAGQIAAGAINTEELYAGAVTTSKLLVTNQGSALNSDPNTQDASAWPNSVPFTIVNDPTSPAGSSAIECSFPGDVRTGFIAIDPSKNYNLRISFKQQSGGPSICYLLVGFYRGDDSPIIGSDSPGWPSTGTYNYFGLMGVGGPAVSPVWTEYQISFGPNETAKINSAARKILIGAIVNYAGSSGVIRMANVRLVEKASANLIVDGAITSQKMTANSINGDRILANSLEASKIVSNSITSGQIQAGAINAEQIAAGAISVNKLLVTPVSLCPDPFFYDWDWWTGTMLNQPGWWYDPDTQGIAIGVPNKVTLWQGTFSGTGRAHLWSGRIHSPPAGTTLRLKAVFNNSSNQSIHVSAKFYNVSAADIGDLTVSSMAGAGTQTITAQGTVPSTAAEVAFVIYNQGGTGYTGISHVSGVMLDVAGSSDMIVDGAITATKISAGAIAVGSAAIQDGAIRNALIENLAVNSAKIADLSVSNGKIANATIEHGKIASVNADSITVGTLRSSTFNGTIDGSGNIVADGTSGWALAKTGGFVANNGVFRGTLTGASGTFSGTLTAANVVTTGNLQNEAVSVYRVATNEHLTNLSVVTTSNYNSVSVLACSIAYTTRNYGTSRRLEFKGWEGTTYVNHIAGGVGSYFWKWELRGYYYSGGWNEMFYAAQQVATAGMTLPNPIDGLYFDNTVVGSPGVPIDLKYELHFTCQSAGVDNMGITMQDKAIPSGRFLSVQEFQK
jgi:hypothetical protein